jgi:hypothetical protein
MSVPPHDIAVLVAVSATSSVAVTMAGVGLLKAAR